MRLTKRDLDMIHLAHDQQSITAEQVMKHYNITKQVAYRRLSGMVGEGYLEYERIFADKPGVYKATEKGLCAFQTI